MTEAFIGTKKAQPVKVRIVTKVPATSPVATFLPPVKDRIREITGLTASEINKMSRKDNKMGDSSENICRKANNSAPTTRYE